MAVANRKLLQLVDNIEKTLEFSIVQYNTLADCYSNTSNSGFPFVDNKYLKWEYRFPLLVSEIKILNADFYCLEEVDHADLISNEFFNEYSTIFNKTTNREHGICILYRKSKFICNFQYTLFFKITGGCAIFACFELIESDNNKPVNIMIIATHLKAKVGNETIRCNQTFELFSFLDDLIKKRDLSKYDYTHTTVKEHLEEIPIILSGDFNDTPDGVLYSLFNTSHSSNNKISSRNWIDLYNHEKIIKEFQNRSNNSEEIFTTLKSREENIIIKRTIDYIWYSNSQNPNYFIKPISCLTTPTSDSFQALLPSKDNPSDHIPLQGIFQIIENKK